MNISYITCGNSANPCVIVPPGGGATKENSLFWAQDLARIGLFVVLYDLRGTGGSYKRDWKQVFQPFGTTAEHQLKRLAGYEATLQGLSKKKQSHDEIPPELQEQLWDYDHYARDAITVLDELNIARAHVMGLSQGGLLAQVIAMQYPERILTCISASTIFDRSGVETVMLSAGAEDFHQQMKQAHLFDEQGNPSWRGDCENKEEYVRWKVKFLEIIIPEFPAHVYHEIAEKEFDTGLITQEECSVCGLSWELWVRAGKLERHHKQLRSNTVPMLYVHGRKDPVIHFNEVERLFQITKNCVLETHNFGHNFGPPAEQKKILGKIATFMKRYAQTSTNGHVNRRFSNDTHASDLCTNLNTDSTVPQLYDTFCSVQTAAETHAVFTLLLEKLQLVHLRGRGLQLFMALRTMLTKHGLNFKQAKLLRDIYATLLKVQAVVGQVKYDGKIPVVKVLEESIELYERDQSRFNKVLVCGAGPIGLRTACELQLLGFDVLVVEKRPSFSRANILTFWDETMADMLGLGAKAYFPNLQPAGINKHLGTRQIQVCLLKTLLLLGGRAEYGMEVCGLHPPSWGKEETSMSRTARWQAFFRPYQKHSRSARTAAELAVEFQKTKDYVKQGDTNEYNPVNKDFVNAKIDPGASSVEFDAYIIAEGGWSDSTQKLGFNKTVQNFKSIYGLVINAKYNQGDMKEKNMRSQIHFKLSGKWPLQRCPIQAEFLEYLKGETHFLALVIPKRNLSEDRTKKYLEKMDKEDRDKLPQSVIDVMTLESTQKGLLEMGVFRKDLGTGRQCLAAHNVDVEQLHAMARDIMCEIGLPEDIPFCESNPVQLFDFSRRARCLDSVRVLHASSVSSSVLAPDDFSQSVATDPPQRHSTLALALPVGDALQEPNWTQGLGINRGFHTAMNQAFACLLAREQSVQAAVTQSSTTHKRMLSMKWGMGHSGLAGSGSGNIGLEPFKHWNTDPRNRIP
uniref:Uncharacterized protein n=1 Tax=Mucochytrium quahogii TaxID=96639 RepID=A0A7S2SIA5_9STRA|mmetsp:Transcript_43932/g.70297  ORF Transcript_43932/g.70297 Transcript_43932/m.70297 type:complete len:967 (+) Transcript_43932:41-2941(+)|eukprot:CAMPEP_0203750200 /NCGR_PEP_ID=MMETSP0098-20131031/4457_1 /ASSEMBLY_ACC=CAM_ASM_000208 /TAXON_ID=96639 /ORGANISM=" , Strain NY0313808BC1" /LENGTH=966 /DNA_ID=CAMNT_0050639381 /DNA_START=17 /DNA_END=2917 /DNA_ORIENTATION=+